MTESPNSSGVRQPAPGPASDTPDPAPGTQNQVLSWSVWRAKENQTRTLLVSMLLVAVVVFAGVNYGPLMAVIAVLVLFLSLNGYYVRQTYTLDQNGVTTDKMFYHYTRRWSEFRSFVRTTSGVVISPFSTWTYLDNFRGIHLLLPRDSSPILEFLRQRLPEKTRPDRRRKN